MPFENCLSVQLLIVDFQDNLFLQVELLDLLGKGKEYAFVGSPQACNKLKHHCTTRFSTNKCKQMHQNVCIICYQDYFSSGLWRVYLLFTVNILHQFQLVFYFSADSFDRNHRKLRKMTSQKDGSTLVMLR